MAMMMSRTKLTPTAASPPVPLPLRPRRCAGLRSGQRLRSPTAAALRQVREGLLKCDPKVLAPEIIKMLIKQVRLVASDCIRVPRVE